MRKNLVLEISPDELIHVETCKFDKKLSLNIDSDYCACIAHDGNVFRVSHSSMREAYRTHKEFRSQDVEITIFRSSEIKKIPWGIGGIQSGKSVIGINGILNFKISNFMLFKKYFGGCATIKSFKNKFLDKIRDVVKNVVCGLAEKYNFDEDEMNKNTKEVQQLILEELEKSDIDCEAMGFDLEEFDVKSFVIK